jgi:hypothetical protein
VAGDVADSAAGGAGSATADTASAGDAPLGAADGGGSGAGATGSKQGAFVAVNAGGQNGQATYFSVCQGSDEQAVRQCSEDNNNNGGN